MGIAIPQVVTEDRAPGAQVIDGSLKFDKSKDQYLKRTASVGNRKTWTWSAWVQKNTIENNQQILFSAIGDASDRYLSLDFRDDNVRLVSWNGSSKVFELLTSRVLRDPSSWYHIVFSVDTTQSTSSDTIKIYINGVKETVFTTASYPSQNTDTYVNAAVSHQIGENAASYTALNFDALMSQVYLIDGQALGPENFGYTDPLTNTWRPKKYDPLALPATSVSWSTLPSGAAFQDSATQVNSGTFNNILTDDSNYVRIANNYLDIDMGETIPAGVKITFKFTSSSDDSSSADYALALSTASNYSPYTEFSETQESETTSDYKTITLITRKDFRYCRFFYAGGGRVARVYYLNITGATASERKTINYGSNGFYLPMDGNSPIGKDLSQSNPINNGTTWSSSLVSSTSNFYTTGAHTIASAFDNDTATYVQQVGGVNPNSITFTPSGGIAHTSTVEIYINNTANEVSYNNGVLQSISSGWNTIATGSGTLTSIKVERPSTSGASFHAIRIDGVLLVDGMYGNSFTPVNFGGSVTLDNPIVSGALPILNTIQGGTAAGVGVRTDAYHANLVLALPLVGSANDVSNSVNSGSTTKAITVTNAVASSAASNFYNGSFYFDGSGDYLSLTTTSDFAFGTGDFTIEFWAYVPTSEASNLLPVFDNDYNSSGGVAVAIRQSDSFFAVAPEASGSGFNYNKFSAPFSLNTWNHFVIGASNGVYKAFLNGRECSLASGSVTAVNVSRSSGTTEIGRLVGQTSFDFGGYLQDLRIYKGAAKYTSNFVVPATSPDILPDTPSGVSGSSKLAKITEGAVAFDGTGDYLDVSDDDDFDFDGDFTVEFYVYFDTVNARNETIGSGNNSAFLGANKSGWIASYYTLGGSKWHFSYQSDNNWIFEYTFSFVSGARRWYHVAFTRSGSDIRCFVDGVQQGSAQTSSATLTSSEGLVRLGGGGGSTSLLLNGRLSNVRIIKGTALYTSNFTPPTAPLTAVTNTKLLCCQSNSSAGRYAVSPTSGGLNDGTIWSSLVSAPDGIHTSRPITNLFNGDTADSANGSLVPTEGSTWTLTHNFGSVSSLKFYTYYPSGSTSTGANAFQVNGVTVTPSSKTQGGYTVLPVAGGTLTSFGSKYTGAGDYCFVSAIEVDGTVLLDPIAVNGNSAATTFNPFTTDINAVRGQETGYCTLNPLDKLSNGVLSDGNLKWTCDNSAAGTVRANISVDSGKWYWEITVDNADRFHAGVHKSDVALITGDAGSDTTNWAFRTDGYKVHGGSESLINSGTSVQNIGNIIQFAYDADNGSIWFGGNGRWFEGNPSALSSPSYTGIAYRVAPFLSRRTGANGATINFGQKPFKYAPPAGFQSLNAANLRPETVIARPDHYVDTALYEGSSSAVTVSNLNLKPDLVWVKNRDQNLSNSLYDSVRGIKQRLISNFDHEESARVNDGIHSFNSDGFTTGVGGNENADGESHVAWTWKAGGDKNTFNVDDVGYVSAADVGMNVGSQSTSSYLQDAIYSDSSNFTYTGTSGFVSGNGLDKLFDGRTDTTVDQVDSWTGGNSAHLTWTPATAIPVTSTLRIYGRWYTDSANNAYLQKDTVKINGGAEVQDTTVNSTSNHWFDLTSYIQDNSITSITEIKGISYPKGGNRLDPAFNAIEVDGKILVDSNQTPPNIPSAAPTGASVGTKQGFSIIKHTGTGSTGTLPHGLTQKPDFYISKPASTSGNWVVYTDLIDGSLDYLYLNTTAAKGDSGQSLPTSEVFSYGYTANEYIHYLWHSVPGLQKFGKYTGNGAQNFVSLDFRPAIVWVKRAVVNSSPDSGSTHSSWTIMDSTRLSYNGLTPNHLYANLAINEGYRGSGSGASNADITLEPLSNGFYLNGPGTETNANTGTYIYCAWAEAPAFNLYGGQSNAR